MVDATGLTSFLFDYMVGKLSHMVLAARSRECELEADVLGLKIAARACFNVEKGITVMEKLMRVSGSSGTGVMNELDKSIVEEEVEEVEEVKEKVKEIVKEKVKEEISKNKEIDPLKLLEKKGKESDEDNNSLQLITTNNHTHSATPTVPAAPTAPTVPAAPTVPNTNTPITSDTPPRPISSYINSLFTLHTPTKEYSWTDTHPPFEARIEALMNSYKEYKEIHHDEHCIDIHTRQSLLQIGITYIEDAILHSHMKHMTNNNSNHNNITNKRITSNHHI